MSFQDLGTSFLGAFQACVSVLLTLSYGVVARYAGLVSAASIKDVSALGIKLFFPALMVVNLGSNLHASSILNYIPILVWSTIVVFVSLVIGKIGERVLRLPAWVTAACAFNNTTALPLLLIQSLESTGSLKRLLKDGDEVSDAVDRSQSYLLICAVVSNLLTYIVGPKLLQQADSAGEDADNESGAEADRANEGENEADEHSPLLLPASVHRAGGRLRSRSRAACAPVLRLLPDKVKEEALSFDTPVVWNMLLGLFLGGLLGLTPPLHRAFFNKSEDGGIFNAWLVLSIKNIGKLFTTLQLFIVGSKLGVSFQEIQRSGKSGHVPWRAVVFVFLVRFVLWPAISISLVYVLADKTSLLGDDPILWFSMMLMPTGPPSLVISGLAELANVSEEEKLTVVKALTSQYALSPFTSFTVAGALHASEKIFARSAK
ncbi:Auxin Efflux Carrier superfamily [Aspergillus homomorphus CBS 101889]|uniref:Auxin efflux carrier superfamily n=1 Tax=Aspergillus homomorphus (strain CBS 101889) TaxID=1450537 RepID=A0A395HP47_ASPHC|nr:auxin efflux carrier superfamily [Aspergillus homomorphus CBS 101889]RAL09386.1 auxin efflux carrier superfamily [Aspergillus homomorphus CBS 101889]